MKINFPVVFIISQTLSSIAFGIFLTMVTALEHPGGKELLSSIFETSSPPIMVIIAMLLLNLTWAAMLTLCNIDIVLKNKTKTVGGLREENDKILQTYGFDTEELDRRIEQLKEDLKK